MSDTPALPPRPDPPRRPAETVTAWLAWFGVGRLVLSAVSVAIVAAGVAWLVRVPAPPTESELPFSAGSTVASTLPPPSTVASPVTTPAGSGPAGPIMVHVAGQVHGPGVYELGPGGRVHDAIEAAGGPTDAGDLDGLNLAAPVLDGSRIYVPATGEVDPASVPSAAPADPTSGAGDSSGPVGPIDLNTATASQLETLPGIGPATAAAIVDDRARHGPFASVDDLERVPGIGPAKRAAVADLVTV